MDSHDRDVNAAKNIKDFAIPNMSFNKKIYSGQELPD